MFTIKVTYRGQIRKHTFSETNTFPAYADICDQLNRVFSIPRAFYLSKLLFSPDAGQPSRILIGKEVHGTYDYYKCIRQFQDRTWPHALLRFTVCDVLSSTLDTGDSSFRSSAGTQFPTSSDHRVSMSHIEHPTIFSSGTPLVSQGPMDVDAAPTLSNHANHHIPPQPNRPTPQPVSCCSVSQGKAEIKAMLTEFKDVLDRVVTNDLSNPRQANISANTNTLTEAPPPSLCSVCTQNIFVTRHGVGSWFSCESCNVVVCVDCHGKERPGFCLNLMRPHMMKFVRTPSGREPGLPIPHLPVPWMPRSASGSTPGFANAPFISTSTLTPETSETANHAHGPAPTSTSSAPVIHRGVVCDVCSVTIEGVRHKCLDCPDYDLCTACISAGCAEAHNPFHEFFDITEPGRVVVHNVFSGNGERETSGASRRASVPEAPAEPVVHLATCDLCDSRILGDRYKCLNCPDFDTCPSCFSITEEQHPKHTFVRIHKREDYLRANGAPRQMHYASCDGCAKTIYGSRFKCLHPECPDYDLCENCEALPIPVHPENHPLLKMKASDTAIPTVYRVGQRNVIPEPPIRQAATATRDSINQDSNMTFAPRRSPSPPRRQPWRPSPPSSVHEERMQTPTPTVRVAPEVSAPTVISVPDSPAALPTSPIMPPPVPPKPEMISHASWASIPGFFGSSMNWDAEPFESYERFPALPDFFGEEVKASLRNPFADIPIPDTPVTPAVPVSQQRTSQIFETVISPEISLPSVPSHTPNPWPTNNPMERQELLQLIADFAGPSASPSVLNALSDDAASNEMRSLEQRKPLVNPFDSESHIPTMPSPPPSVRPLHCNPPVNPDLQAQVHLPSRVVPTAKPTAHDNAKDKTTTNAAQQPENKDSATSSDEDANVGFADFSMSHLLQVAIEANKAPSVAGSSVSGEALLKRPSSETSTPRSSSRPSLADLICDLPSLIPSKVQDQDTVLEGRIHLSAAFIEDVTVPDGQVFPPGAEFMKCWRLLNDGGRDWPESTELVFVAGESLLTEKSSPSSVELGKVSAGAEIDVWTGELKAPDAPGRYVGYWRLKADGEVFGNSLWIEINVVEADSHHSSDESMASSSVIMPTVSSAPRSQHVASTTVRSVSGPTSISSTEDNISDAGSDISLISMPSSPSDSEDEALFHDSRSQTTAERAAAAAASAGTPSSAIDYVLLYDDNSSEEE